MVATVPGEAKSAVSDPSRALEGGSTAGGRPVGERPPPSVCRPPTRAPGRASKLVFRGCAGSLPVLPPSPGCSNGWGARPRPTACGPAFATVPPGRRTIHARCRRGACAPPGPQRPMQPAGAHLFERRGRLKGWPGRRTCPPETHGRLGPRIPAREIPGPGAFDQLVGRATVEAIGSLRSRSGNR